VIGKVKTPKAMNNGSIKIIMIIPKDISYIPLNNNKPFNNLSDI